jgi:DNA-binding response OmpR family regulator
VILMSAKTDPADHFWASEVGALVLVPKPIDMPHLLERIAAALAAAAAGKSG